MQFRLKSHEEFQSVVKQKQVVKNQSFVLYYALSEKKVLQVGISVSKKLGCAVKRNRIKRQVRHMAHELLDEREPIAVAIIVRSRYQTEDFAKMKEDLDQVLRILRRKINEKMEKMD